MPLTPVQNRTLEIYGTGGSAPNPDTPRRYWYAANNQFVTGAQQQTMPRVAVTVPVIPGKKYLMLGSSTTDGGGLLSPTRTAGIILATPGNGTNIIVNSTNTSDFAVTTWRSNVNELVLQNRCFEISAPVDNVVSAGHLVYYAHPNSTPRLAPNNFCVWVYDSGDATFRCQNTRIFVLELGDDDKSDTRTYGNIYSANITATGMRVPGLCPNGANSTGDLNFPWGGDGPASLNVPGAEFAPLNSSSVILNCTSPQDYLIISTVVASSNSIAASSFAPRIRHFFGSERVGATGDVLVQQNDTDYLSASAVVPYTWVGIANLSVNVSNTPAIVNVRVSSNTLSVAQTKRIRYSSTLALRMDRFYGHWMTQNSAQSNIQTTTYQNTTVLSATLNTGNYLVLFATSLKSNIATTSNFVRFREGANVITNVIMEIGTVGRPYTIFDFDVLRFTGQGQRNFIVEGRKETVGGFVNLMNTQIQLVQLTQ